MIHELYKQYQNYRNKDKVAIFISDKNTNDKSRSSILDDSQRKAINESNLIETESDRP